MQKILQCKNALFLGEIKQEYINESLIIVNVMKKKIYFKLAFRLEENIKNLIANATK